MAGVIGGSAAGTPFALAAASHGTTGLLVGAAVVVATTLFGADGLFWPMALMMLNRQQRWAWRKTHSVKDTLRLDAPARRTLEKTVRARAGIAEDSTPEARRRQRRTPRGR
ncbi:hypothetical protein GCM10010252_27570 [Streptomyces aureoverticillatus]|nr:hypothetical protein GCM10010252_27570 [Streptomyces aureoverticillatus]